MPAAAVIPAPMVYANIVAVKKLVVGFLHLAYLTRAYFKCESRAIAVHPSQ